MKVHELAARTAMLAILATACAKKGDCETLVTEVVGDPSHTAKVSPDRVQRGVAGTYRVHGAAHQHAFALKDEDMQTLMSGGSVTARTSSSNGHLHEVRVRCER